MKTWTTNQEDPKDLFYKMNIKEHQISEELPKEISEWLAEICLLRGLPLPYLVPSEKLLPWESMRLFYIDPNWIDALVSGAASIGKNTTSDSFLYANVKSTVVSNSYCSLNRPREKRMHMNHRRHWDKRYQISPYQVLTGFLLRSQLISFFKGIEVRGYGKNKKLEILRMDVIGNSIMLCIFDGAVDKIEFVEPAEALHFGTRDYNRTIRVRKISGSKIGEPLPDKEIKLPVSESRRLDVTALGARLEKELDTGLTSAELALEMLSVAGRCVIEQKSKTNVGGAHG